MAITVPAKGQFEFKVGSLPRSKNLNIKFQGGGWSWEDKIGLFWSRGNSANSNEIVMSFSSNGGLDWEPVQTQGITGSPNFAAHAQLPFNNRWALYAKGDNADPYRLWTKPIPRYDVEMTTVATTSQSRTVTITWPNHGLKTGDLVRFDKFSSASGGGLNGVTSNMLSGADKSVTVIDANTFSSQTNQANQTATSGGSGTMFVGLRVLDAAWVETRYSSGTRSFEEAVTFKIPEITNVSVLQGAATLQNGDLVMPMSGAELFICKIPNPISGGVNDFAKRDVFSKGTGGKLTEPTIAKGPGNAVFGFLRTQDASIQKPAFWHSANGGTTVSQSNLAEAIGTISPIPCALGDDNKIYAFLTDRTTASTGTQGVVGVYLLVADYAAAASQGASAFSTYRVGDIEILALSGNDPNRSSEATNSGRPTAVKHGSWIFFFYEEEEWAAVDGSAVDIPWSNIKYLAVNTRPLANELDAPLAKRGAMG